MLLIAISIIGIIKLNDKKEIELKEEIYEINKKQFSMFISDEEGNYTEYTESNKFPEGYTINLENSKCIDTKGNELDGILSGNGTNITVTSTKTSYCYLYFDIEEPTAAEYLIENVSSDVLWNSTLESDGYRYVGTDPANYICFGTTDKEECINDTDKYMYRIIGIFEDEEGIQHLKLIKKEALNTTYMWNEDCETDTIWEDSDLYKGLNGISGGVYSNLFVGSDTYSYMSTSSDWYNKIETWDYTATNTLTAEKSGLYYSDETPQNIYLHEMNRSTKTYSVGEWFTVKAKIGLMYVSDYALSLGETAATMTGSTFDKASTLKKGWMHLNNNDSGVSDKYEWTMTRYGIEADVYYVYTSSWDGSVDYAVSSISSYLVRPVFYLTEDTIIESGNGSSSDPYIIYQEPTDTEKLIENVSSDVLWNSTLESDGYRYVGTDPANYVCFGYDDVSEDCDFTNATNADLYAYRIIGIFEDEEGIQHLKLIKKEALNTAYIWNEDYETDIDWDESDLYKGLNGISGGVFSNLFVGSDTYNYMSTSSDWYNKIETWKWTATNTQTYYIGSSTSNVGTNYYNSWPIGIYNSEHEIDTTTGCYQISSGSAINCKTTASYTYPEAKIGLMYASDYALSLGETAATMTGSTNTNRTTLKTGWMHISNNDSDAYDDEWTSSRYGYDDEDWFFAWRVSSNGSVYWDYAEDSNSVRPVFYLKSDVTISGEGTTTNPYIIGM